MHRLLMIIGLISTSLPVIAHTPHHVVDALELSPDYENDSTLFILVHNYLLRSIDRAASWKQLVSGIDSPHVLSDIAVSQNFAVDNTLFVSTDGSGIYRSANRGQSWSKFNNGLRQQKIGMLLVIADPNEPLVLAAGSSRGLFVSSAQTAGWRRAISDDVQITVLRLVEENSSAYVLAGDSTGGI